MEKVDTLIYAKWLLPCDGNQEILENHALAIQNGKIKSILPIREADQKFEATHKHHYDTHAVLPGFINTHTHSAMTVFRGLADDLELMDWLNNYIWPSETKWVSEELVFDASLIAMAEMIRCGTVCFNDMYFFIDSTAKAAQIAGLRAHIGMTVIDVPTAWAKTPDEYFAKGIEFYQEYKNNERIVPTLAPHSTYAVSPKALNKVRELAEQYHLRINIHLQEAPSEIQQALSTYHKRPLQRLHTMGMVSPELIAIHMTQLDDADFELLQETKPNIVHCPESNMKTVSGICPVERLANLGINVSLGTDGAASNNDLDMIGEMRSAAFLGKVSTANPKAISANYALRMATINGAKTLGIDHLTGSLVAGKEADFIAIDLEELETQPLYNPISQIVYAASRHQVTDVWSNGKQLLKNRKLTTLDEAELIEKAKYWRKKIKD